MSLRHPLLAACAALALLAGGACSGDGGGSAGDGDTGSADTGGGDVSGGDTGGDPDGTGDTADDTAGAPDTAAPDTGPPVCAAGTPCDDGDPCTEGDACDGLGGCAGTAVSCDDGLDCTQDACGAGGCEHTLKVGFCLSEVDDASACVTNLQDDPLATCRICDASGPGAFAWITKSEGSECDDFDACTSGDICEVGVCVGKKPVTCTTTNACVEAACDPAEGCVEVPVDAPCDDGNACTVDDTCQDGACVGGGDAPSCDDGDACTVGDACKDGACVPGADALPCDDGDACTLDACDPATGCTHDPDGKCDDGNACTADVCQPDGSCVNTPFEGPCDDGDACTVGETCGPGGGCVGGVPADCDDLNECTEDACDVALGCLNTFVDGEPCDDGYACTTGDICAVGACVGNKSFCSFCPEPVSDHAAKLNVMEISADGYEGSGLDVDEDPTSCAPAGECSGGVDNALSFLAAVVNGPLADSLGQGSLMYVADLAAATFDGQPFPVAIYQSELTFASEIAGCDFQAEACEYNVTQSSFDGGCNPYFAFDNATIEGGVMNAGGKDFQVAIVFPLGGGAFLPLTVAGARIKANVTLTDDGLKVQSIVGVLAGAMPKQQLIDTIKAVDEDLLLLDKDLLVTLAEELVENDIDLDGNGVLDAASIGLRIQTLPGVLK